jgi:hypothetical protein
MRSNPKPALTEASWQSRIITDATPFVTTVNDWESATNRHGFAPATDSIGSLPASNKVAETLKLPSHRDGLKFWGVRRGGRHD